MIRKDNRCKGCIYRAKRTAPYKCDYTEVTGRCRIVNGTVQSADECTFFRPCKEAEITEEEIRTWLNQETSRLGDQLTGFVITWHRDEVKHWLEIWSETKNTRPDGLYGRCLKIEEVPTDKEWLAMPILQDDGQKLYYELRKSHPVKRDLRKAAT